MTDAKGKIATGVIRGAAMAGLGLLLAACETETPSARMDPLPPVVSQLPDSTPRIDARAQREAQLRTGTYHDDIPELTGAPGTNARWPAPVYRDRRAAYNRTYVALR